MDGHTHCFKCGKTEQASDWKPSAQDQQSSSERRARPLVKTEVAAFGARGITEDTAKRFGYHKGTSRGRTVHVAHYRDQEGRIAKQKLRFKDKSFDWLGHSETPLQLFGQHLFSGTGRKVVVTEGEIDALTMSQVQGNKWPVVSVPNGSKSVKAIKDNIAFLEGYDQVIFMFDGDEAGREGAKALAQEISPGKAYIAELPQGLDPNDMLMAGQGEKLIEIMWDARSVRPDGIKNLQDLREEVLKDPEQGLSYPWPSMTANTFGIRRKEIYGWGGGVGSGKTTAFMQIAEWMVMHHNLPIGLIYYEQPPTETGKRMAGLVANRQFHIPNPIDGEPLWTKEELMAAFDKLGDKVNVYDHFGAIEWAETAKHIRHMAKCMGVRDFFLDHLTALTAHAEDERRCLDGLMEEMASLAQELDITIHYVSHLTTPSGDPHEEGGQISAKHFTGSRGIMRWSHFMFGLERNQQDEDKERRKIATVRCVKDRFTGQANGRCFYVKYDDATGHLKECAPPRDEDEAFDPSAFDETNDEKLDF